MRGYGFISVPHRWFLMFYVFLTSPHQVEASASNLNTNDVFVLKSPKDLFVWRGVGASEEEMKAAKHVVGFLGGSPTNVSEGKEPGGSQAQRYLGNGVNLCRDFLSMLTT